MADGETPGPPAPDEHPSGPQPVRKLTRSRNDRVIAGVAGGLAEYLGIDSVLVRVALVVLVLLGFGAGVLLYLIMWIVVPEDTHAQAAAKGGERGPGVSSDAAAYVVGGLLILVGAMWLVRMFVPFFFELRILGPLVLLAVGFAIVAQGLRR
jgi:phage shock protein C